MKKHPVDDLFKRKMEGLERKPSADAWLKIQEKQSVKSSPALRRAAVWGWYAAAGVAAAVMGGYLVWQNQQVVAPGSINAEKVAAIARQAQPDSAVNAAIKANAPVQQIAAIEKGENALEQKAPKDLMPAAKPPRVSKIQAIEEPIQPMTVVAVAEKPSVPVNAIESDPLNIPVRQEVKILPDEPAVSQVNKPETEPTRTIVVAVETGNSETDDKPRSSRFSRVFRQLKNARAGEKVDWDEVGFNPKSLVARVDDRLRGRDEKSLEKDHPKEKTKL
nr:hypothetical protein [uncultured Dyadobacter sp.]